MLVRRREREEKENWTARKIDSPLETRTLPRNRSYNGKLRTTKSQAGRWEWPRLISLWVLVLAYSPLPILVLRFLHSSSLDLTMVSSSITTVPFSLPFPSCSIICLTYSFLFASQTQQVAKPWRYIRRTIRLFWPIKVCVWVFPFVLLRCYFCSCIWVAWGLAQASRSPSSTPHHLYPGS